MDAGGEQKDLLPKICYAFPAMIKLGTFIHYLKKVQEIEDQVTYLWSSAGISSFSPEISKFSYITKYIYILDFGI